ncbi:P-loop containing nucleoside triphosphate hydrolase protein [Pelagophyceae sp. CCMP2097]|nr:P-loop containing nucleoside triphosphate hydrolase protein [Pelagophyceae sp. CCMP2097]
MDAQLRSACRAFGQDPDGEAGGGIVDSDAFPGGLALYENSRPWAPPLQHVVVEDEARFLAKRIGEEVADDDEDDDDDDEEDAVDDVKDNGSADKVGWAATTQGRSRDPPPVPPSLQNGGPMAAQRQGLPVFEHRQVLLDALASLNGDAPCLLVEGETGSGKSTQVPQYILEDCASRGAACNIVVTQPRRIAAIGVAERICAERGERCGETVGFAIRGESKQSPRTALLFNTTGVALRRLQEDALDGVTHLIVDEVHERTLEADFLLLAVRRVVQLRRERGAEPLRVVLMSATMPVGSIRSYFGKDCPSVKFPGRTFPVAALYLEHALAVTRHVVDSRADWHRSSLASQRRAKQRGAPNDRGQEAEGAYREVRVLGDDVQRRFNNWPSGVGRAMQEMDEDALNIDLVVQLVSWFADTCRGNVDAAVSAISKSNDEDQRRSDDRPVRADDDERLAVLVFCSGTKEIDGVIQALQSTRCLQGDAQRQWLLPLHGGLSPDDQRKCFLNAPKGITKVVVATNVAETSVTIPDVGFVVDSGRVKEERYDAERHVASLDDVWISQASARQRRGRAGRVRAGLAVHLYPSDAPLRQQSEPEVRRVALEQLVLRIKALPEGLLEEGTAAAACAALPEPPEPAAVTGAAEMLIAIGALEEIGEGSAKRESLTQLGALLARLPVDVRLGKLAVLGACFGPAALDDALTVAAALANRSPFMAPVSNRDAADASKRGFIDQHAGASGCGCEASDLIATRNAYRAFEDLGDRDRYDFARQRFLSIKTLQAIASLKRQLLEGLSSASFVVQPGLRSSTIERMGRERGGTDGVRAALGLFEQRFAQTSNELLAGLIGAALYPQLAYVSAPPTKKGPCSADAVKLHVRDPDASRSEPQACSVHPSSVASKLGGAGWRTPYAACEAASGSGTGDTLQRLKRPFVGIPARPEHRPRPLARASSTPEARA